MRVYKDGVAYVAGGDGVIDDYDHPHVERIRSLNGWGSSLLTGTERLRMLNLFALRDSVSAVKRSVDELNRREKIAEYGEWLHRQQAMLERLTALADSVVTEACRSKLGGNGRYHRHSPASGMRYSDAVPVETY